MNGDAPGAERDPQACRRRALDLLARREHTLPELERKLGTRGFAPETVACVLTELEAEGLIDVARFAEAFVRSRIGKGQGPVRIRGAMLERGIGEADAERALADHDWSAHARQVRLKKYGAALPEAFAERMRQSRFLQYRGFTGDQIRHALADH